MFPISRRQELDDDRWDGLALGVAALREALRSL